MFGDNLRLARNRKGLSQKALAEAVFVSQQAVWKWESNRATPGPEMIVSLAKALGVSTSDLLGDDNIKKGPAELHADKAQKAYDIIRSLPEDRQTEALRYLEYLEQQGKQ